MKLMLIWILFELVSTTILNLPIGEDAAKEFETFLDVSDLTTVAKLNKFHRQKLQGKTALVVNDMD